MSTGFSYRATHLATIVNIYAQRTKTQRGPCIRQGTVHNFFTSTVDDNTKQILETTVQTRIGDDTRYVHVLRMKTYATREHVGYDCRLISTYAYHMFMHQDDNIWFVHWC